MYFWNHEIPLEATKFSHPKEAISSKKLSPHKKFELPRLVKFSEISKRPLFTPSRRQMKNTKLIRPTTKTPIKKKEHRPKTPINQIELIGIIKKEKYSLALLKTPKFLKGTWVKKESDFEGWKILEIHSDNIILVKQSKKHKIYLYKKK